MAHPIKRILLVLAGLTALAITIMIGLAITATTLASCTVKAADQRALLQAELPEVSLASAQIEAFSCEGFQDLSISAELSLTSEDTARTIAALDQTYRTPQDHPLVAEAQKRREQTRLPDATRLRYTLPGTGVLHTRTIRLDVPDDQTQPTHLAFGGWQF